jgi:hypothetical protein
MPCEACTEALRKPHSGMYFANCLDCTARMLAHSPQYWEASRAEAITASYGTALKAAFGERWKEGHSMVKRWADLK